MSSRPLIGISGRTKTAGELKISPRVFNDLQVDLFYCDYASGVIAAGGLPVFLPTRADPSEYADRLDGLLLSGGTDIEPARYGQAEAAELYKLEPDRDAFEMALLDGLADSDVPVLGICRGIQLINVHGGGTLHQHVADHARYDQPVNAATHRIDLQEGSLAASLYGQSVDVNSLHHQLIDTVADGFKATGRTSEGHIEVIEATDKPWLGVQWHPELLDSRDSDPVFDWLVSSAS